MSSPDGQTPAEAAGTTLPPPHLTSEESARQVIVRVSLIGSLLVALGLLASVQLDQPSRTRLLAVAALCLALLAVTVALALLLLPPARVPSPVRRYGAVASALCLLLAVLLAGAAAVTMFIRDPPGPQPAVSTQMVGVGSGAHLTVRVAFTGVAAGQILHTEITGIDAADTRTVLARAVANAGRDGTVSTALEVTGLGEYRSVDVTAATGTQQYIATLAPGWTSKPGSLRCSGR